MNYPPGLFTTTATNATVFNCMLIIKLISLYQELRTAFDAEHVRTGRPKLLLTAAVGAGKKTIDAGYEIDIISE